MRRSLLCAILIVSGQLLSAQVRNDDLEYRVRPDSLRTKELNISLFNFNYLRNYEFFNRFQDGYTLYGTQLEPQLNYYPHPRLLISAGIHLRKDFGRDGIYKSYPLFSIKYQKGKTAFINGALEGNIHHRFIEPIFDVEKKITDPVEYGSQLFINSSKVFLDAFVNWKRMIYKPSAAQEQILAGGTANIGLVQTKKLKFSFPLQLLAFHQGGQIDTVAAPLQTLVNAAVGFKAEISGGGFIKMIRTENYILAYKELSPTKSQVFPHGDGIYLNAGVETRLGSLTASYWTGNKFISSSGMPIFQSVSQQIDHPGYFEQSRELVFIRYAWQKQLIPGLFLDFRVEPVIDLGPEASKPIEFYHSMFLVYKQEIKLLK